MMIKYTLCFLLLLSITIVAQMPDMGYSQLLNPQYEVGSEEEAMDKMQALFIQEIFIKPLFQSTNVIDFDDDDDEIYNTKQSNELMNVMYARELSKQLAKQDLLNLNDYFMQ